MVLNDAFVSENVAFSTAGNCRDQKFNNININRVKIIRKGISLTTSISSAVFHSVIEGFSKYMPFYYNKSILKDRSIILPAAQYRTNPSLEILKILGSFNNSVYIAPIIVKELIIPLPGTCGCGKKENIVKLNNQLILKLKYESDLSKKKLLLIKRKNNRKFENFNETFDYLKLRFREYEISVYDDEFDFNYRAILLKFYEANIVIGVHGAGLTNIISCRKNTIIIEISATAFFEVFRGLSSQLNLKFYRYLY